MPLSNLEKFCSEHNPYSIINFGKYRGMTINEIGEIDSGYVLYLYSNNLIKPNKKLLGLIEQLYDVYYAPPNDIDELPF